MIRDMDLVRDLLRKLQDEPLDGRLYRLEPERWDLLGRSYDDVAFHLVLLLQAELLDGEREMSGGFVARLITWKGYDFLDAVSDDSIWARTKSVASKAGGFTVDILLEIAKGLIKEKLTRLAGGAP